MLGSSQDLNMVAQNRRRQPSSYCYGPIVQTWTTHTSLRRQAWWWRRSLVMIPLSDRVPGRASEPSQTRVDDGGSYRTFHGWRLGCLGFSRGCELWGPPGSELYRDVMCISHTSYEWYWGYQSQARTPSAGTPEHHRLCTSQSVMKLIITKTV
jgi:hypothetical protein